MYPIVVPHRSRISSSSGMLRNLMITPGRGSFPIFISARGDRWFSITHRHRCCRGVTLFSCTFHSFNRTSKSGLMLTLNLWLLGKLNTPHEHPEKRSILATDWRPNRTEVSNGKDFMFVPSYDLNLISTPLRMYREISFKFPTPNCSHDGITICRSTYWFSRISPMIK